MHAVDLPKARRDKAFRDGALERPARPGIAFAVGEDGSLWGERDQILVPRLRRPARGSDAFTSRQCQTGIETEPLDVQDADIFHTRVRGVEHGIPVAS
jgi:hypothetical protein